MPSFRDGNDKTWEVRVDVAAVKRVLEFAKVDLRVIESGKTLAELALDPVKLVDTLYAIVKPQADAAGLTDEQFGGLFAGDVLEQAATALMDGILDFFPASQSRALGKLRKLNIRAVSWNTVKNILKENGYDPGPQRGHGTWDEFIKIHAATLWQCDFVSKRIVTPKGLRDAFLLVFLQVETRRVYISPATHHPNEAWVNEQAEAFLKFAKKAKLGAEVIMHDRDTKFARSFDARLEKAGVRVQWTAYRSPNKCAFVERLIQTLGEECLDYFVVLGERHLNYLVREFLEHYHLERPHQALDNKTVVKKRYRRKTTDEATTLPLGGVACKTRLGGLLKHYYQEAA
jgi:putative transposase